MRHSDNSSILATLLLILIIDSFQNWNSYCKKDKITVFISNRVWYILLFFFMMIYILLLMWVILDYLGCLNYMYAIHSSTELFFHLLLLQIIPFELNYYFFRERFYLRYKREEDLLLNIKKHVVVNECLFYFLTILNVSVFILFHIYDSRLHGGWHSWFMWIVLAMHFLSILLRISDSMISKKGIENYIIRSQARSKPDKCYGKKYAELKANLKEKYIDLFTSNLIDKTKSEIFNLHSAICQYRKCDLNNEL